MPDTESSRTYVVQAAKPTSFAGLIGALMAIPLVAIAVATFVSGDLSGWAKAGVVAAGFVAYFGALYLAAGSLKVDETSLRFDGDVLLIQQRGKSDIVRWSDVANASVIQRGTGRRVLWRDLVLHLRTGETNTIREINRLGFADGGKLRRVDAVGEQEAALLAEIRAHVEVRTESSTTYPDRPMPVA